jgi:hypothetical protein
MVTTKWYNYRDLVCHSLKESDEFFKRIEMQIIGFEEGMKWLVGLPKILRVIWGNEIFRRMIMITSGAEKVMVKKMWNYLKGLV